MTVTVYPIDIIGVNAKLNGVILKNALIGQDYDFISRDEERDLLIQAKQGCLTARDRLIVSHMPFLIKMCYRFKPMDMDAEDFIGDAVIGFIKAIETCKVNHPCRFSTYARFRVSKHILKSDFYKRTIGIPYVKRSRYRKLQEAEVRLFVNKGCVMIDTLADMTGFSKDEVKRLQRCEQFVCDLLSLESTSDVSGEAFINLLPAENTDTYYEGVNIQIDLEYFLSKITHRERFVVERRSGIPVELNNKQISRHLGVSETTVSKIYKQAMHKLQNLAKALQGTPQQVRKAMEFPQVAMAEM